MNVLVSMIVGGVVGFFTVKYIAAVKAKSGQLPE